MGGSVIGPATVIRGNIRGSGDVEVLGRVEGDITVDGDVVLGELCNVKGRVSGARVTVGGVVEGDLSGREAVLVERGARVVGDLIAPRIGIADGAVVRGHVRTEGEPATIEKGPTARAKLQNASAELAATEATGTENLPRPIVPKPPPANSVEPVERRPPAPVVPALSKGARGRKKTPGR